jgi:hypothetical protein
MYRVFFSNKPLKKNHNNADRFPETNSEVNKIVSNLESETEIKVHTGDQNDRINEIVNSLEPETEINVHAANQNDRINKIVNSLEPGTEINVYTADQTYYNALFLAFDSKTDKVSLLTDRFYKQGNHLTILEGKHIVSIDLPVSADFDEKPDLEDE